MGLALALIIFRGSVSDGQTSIFGSFLSNYIEETAASITNQDLSQNQLADINSVFAYSAASNRQVKSSILSMIQDNSVVSRGTILTDILDEFSDHNSEVTTYEVQEGDSISFIASDFGVKVNTVIWANNLKSADAISPGMILKIPPIDGVIHKVKKGDTVASIAKKYGADAANIISFNSLPKEGDLNVDSEINVPGGKIIGSTSTGIAQSSTAVRFSYLPSLSGFFTWPATGYDWGVVHGRNGVDIANSCGTPIYAAADGQITLAKSSGWKGGFGKFIKMSHANSTETLYAHMTKLLVEVGQYVSKNQQIGVMGTTGHSTGCHLHFEVHGAKNPLAKS